MVKVKNCHKLKDVKAKLHREFLEDRLSQRQFRGFLDGKYYVSILVETEHKELAHTKDSIGIDLGIKRFMHYFQMVRYMKNPKIIRKYERQLVKATKATDHIKKREVKITINKEKDSIMP